MRREITIKKTFLLVVLALASISAKAQYASTLQKATVSYLTSQNIYVRMEDASSVEVGDTLFIMSDSKLLPALIVTARSSISCITDPIGSQEISKGATVFFKERVKNEKPVNDEAKPAINAELTTQSDKPKKQASRPKEHFSGRISAASYSSIAKNTNMSSHRILERAQFDIEHIRNSNFSIESYFTMNQNFLNRDRPTTLSPNRFRVYNLALLYEKKDLTVTFGRRINRNMSSIGAVDGLQVEKSLGNFSVGAIAGSKPDLNNYSLNPKLGQYGAYVAFAENRHKNFRSTSTVGFIEQQNSSKTDRRYTYLQHQSSVFGKLNLFASSELDLYTGNVDSLKAGPRLTNFFASARYRTSKGLSMMVSYDQRKRVIYYQSYQMDIESILKNDMITSGWRTRINYQFGKNLYTGITYNTRNRINSNFSSFGGYFTLSNLPIISGSLSAYYNHNGGHKLSSKSLSTSYRTSLLKNKLSTYYYYRYVTYASPAVDGTMAHQHYYGGKINYSVTKNLSMGLLGEYSYNETDKNYRINAQIIKRFN